MHTNIHAFTHMCICMYVCENLGVCDIKMMGYICVNSYSKQIKSEGMIKKHKAKDVKIYICKQNKLMGMFIKDENDRYLLFINTCIWNKYKSKKL